MDIGQHSRDGIVFLFVTTKANGQTYLFWNETLSLNFGKQDDKG